MLIKSKSFRKVKLRVSLVTKHNKSQTNHTTTEKHQLIHEGDTMFLTRLPEEADIVVIGGGIVGCAIARELSRYNTKVVLVEKNPDLSWGTTKANLGMIHAFVLPIQSLKGKLCLKGNAMYDKLANDLNIKFKRPGLLLVALTLKENFYRLAVYIWAKIHKIPVQWVSKGKLKKMEPNLTPKAKGGILFPTAGIVSPYEVTLALAENAITNGVKIAVNTEVIDIIVENNQVREVITNRGVIKTKFVINAAGLYADKIAEMVGEDTFTIRPHAGTILIFDKKLQGHYNHIITRIPLKVDPRTKGGGAAITVDGNPIWGPNFRENYDKENYSTEKEDIELVFKKFSELLPKISKRDIISFFTGLRAVAELKSKSNKNEKESDFIIGPTKIKGFINVAGIQSPGLTAAPAIAEMVVEILRNEGAKLIPKKTFNPVRPTNPRFSELSLPQMDEMIKKDAKYGNIVCRCEKVTEAEIVEAIRKGATTIDGIKFRTRAGMGRCQGSFCLPRILKILSRELKTTPEKITKRGGNSYIVCCETKELRRQNIERN